MFEIFCEFRPKDVSDGIYHGSYFWNDKLQFVKNRTEY